MPGVANFTFWFLLMELIAAPIFLGIRHALGPRMDEPPGEDSGAALDEPVVTARQDTDEAPSFDSIETYKGTLERLVLALGLYMGFPHVLTVFGALKIANRLKSEQGDDRAMNYFMVGNLISLLLVFLFIACVTHLPLFRS
ncbi:MAG: hypothetical protein AAGG99_04300 [Pseudomonadota bacterium]